MRCASPAAAQSRFRPAPCAISRASSRRQVRPARVPAFVRHGRGDARDHVHVPAAKDCGPTRSTPKRWLSAGGARRRRSAERRGRTGDEHGSAGNDSPASARSSTAAVPFRATSSPSSTKPGVRLADRQVGQVVVRGPSISPGYFEEPELTSADVQAASERARRRSPWLYTGDLGYIVGRSPLHLRPRQRHHHRARAQLLPQRHRVGGRSSCPASAAATWSPSASDIDGRGAARRVLRRGRGRRTGDQSKRRARASSRSSGSQCVRSSSHRSPRFRAPLAESRSDGRRVRCTSTERYRAHGACKACRAPHGRSPPSER